MIRLARKGDIDAILKLTRACAQKMIDVGIFQWNEEYPSRAAFDNDVARQELYVLEEAENLLGCVVISTFEDLFYKEVTWLSNDDKPSVYIHRLAVHPDCQGQGIAQKLMFFAENLAKEGNFQSVRLDTFSQNERNQKFYEKRGYQKLGAIYFLKQSKHPFYCYELPLKG